MKRKNAIVIFSGVITLIFLILLMPVFFQRDDETGNLDLRVDPSRSPLLSMIGKDDDSSGLSIPEEIEREGLSAGDLIRKQREALGGEDVSPNELAPHINFVSLGDTISFKRVPTETYLRNHESNVPAGLTEQEWPALMTYKLGNGFDKTEVRQYLRFRENQGDDIVESARITFTENNEDESGDFLVIESGDDFFEYEMKFMEGFRSQMSTSNGVSKLSDFNGEKLYLFGRQYKIFNAKIIGSEISFDLIGGFKEYGNLRLEEGEEEVVQLDFRNHSIKIEVVEDSTQRVIITFDGEKSKVLDPKEVYKFKGGYVVGLSRSIINEAEEVDGSDIATVVIGHNESGRRLIKDSNYADNLYTSNAMEVNGKTILGPRFRFEGHLEDDSDVFVLDSIKYRLTGQATGGNVYLGAGQSLRDVLRDPEALLFDIYYTGLTGSDSVYNATNSSRQGAGSLENLFDIYSVDDEEYRLAFKNKDGNIFDFVFYNDDEEFKDKKGRTFYFNESANNTDFVVDEEDLILLTDDNDRTGHSAVFRFEEFDNNNLELLFTRVSDQNNIYVPLNSYTAPICGDVNLDGNLTGADSILSSQVAVGSASFPATLDLDCADVNSDGSFTIIDALKINQSIEFGNVTLTCPGVCLDINSSFRSVLSGDLISGGTPFTIRVNNGSSNIKLAVDLNGDGLFNDEVVEAVTLTGARINFNSSTPIEMIRDSEQFTQSRNNDSVINLSIFLDSNSLYVSVPSNDEISMIEASQANVTIGGTTFAVTPGDRIGQSLYGDIVYERDRTGGSPNDLSVLQFVYSSTPFTSGNRTQQSAGELVLG